MAIVREKDRTCPDSPLAVEERGRALREAKLAFMHIECAYNQFRSWTVRGRLTDDQIHLEVEILRARHCNAVVLDILADTEESKLVPPLDEEAAARLEAAGVDLGSDSQEKGEEVPELFSLSGQKLTEEQLEEWRRKIDAMDQEACARLQRFAKSGHPVFNLNYTLHAHFQEHFQDLGGMTPEISKRIGLKE